MRTVLGIEVDEELVASWRRWVAPARQPFFVEGGPTAGWASMTEEQRDTFCTWNVSKELGVVWHDEDSFAALPPAERAEFVRQQVRVRRGAVPVVRRWADRLDGAALRAQAGGRRFVWWPSLVDDAVATRVVESDHRDLAHAGAVASRHREVDEATWARAADVLPGARTIAGTFPRSSGPNCFGTVLGAAGVGDGSNVDRPTVVEWLATACRPGGRDDEPGTVLVWSTDDGPVHAAVTLGDGWLLEKPSQCWWTARSVLTVTDALRANRAPGQGLQRHHLV